MSTSSTDTENLRADHTNHLLEVQGVTVKYGDFTALSGVSLNVDAGKVHAVIGPNGAGKSTLAGVISGDISPQRGAQVFIEGTEVTGQSAWRRARLGLGRTYQVARVFDSLTVEENLHAASRNHNSNIELALEISQLSELASVRAKYLSTGDKKRLEIALLVAQGARLLVLDEPMAGVSEHETALMAVAIQDLVRHGAGVLMVEHDLDVVFSLASVVTVLNFGQIVFSGNGKDVLANPLVREVYLSHRQQQDSETFG